MAYFIPWQCAYICVVYIYIQMCTDGYDICPHTDNSVSSEKANFYKEIEMMKKVSGGENGLRRFVVNMVGCVTMQEPMLLILEFVSKGDLLSYLRSIRKQVLKDF